MSGTKPIIGDIDPAETVYPDMPNHVATDAAICAAVDVGLAKIEAGETVPIETVIARSRRKARVLT